MTKANESQQEKYRGGLVPMDDIEKHAPIVKANNEKITEAQQELVHVILHDGCNPTEASKRLGRNKAWAFNTLRKQHVIEYRQQLAMMTLGWDATQAMATMRELLNSNSQYVRLEAARDLMDRAGFRQDVKTTTNTAVQINFNVD
tara:strand:+ start:1852 stop:2286 length:435 start_codon:yes stop_codon:yes gene_type:complete